MKKSLEILELLKKHTNLIHKRIDRLEAIFPIGLQLLGNKPYLVFFDNEKNKYYYVKVEMIHKSLK